MRRALCITLCLAVGCSGTGLGYLEVPLHVAGTEGARAPVMQGDLTLTLERAEVGVGPLWLCATENASPESCESALLELRGAVPVDALEPSPVMVATLTGVTGTARTAMFDYGISWLAPASRARALEGAPSGHSAVFRARVVRASDGLAFGVEADVDIVPTMAGALAIPGRRIDAHELSPDRPDALVVRVDVGAWWSRVDLARLAARAEDGEDPVVLRPGDADYEALVVAMTAGVLPALEWGAR